MLLSIKIQNFALIDSLEIGFGTGLHVMTGETGAGKSIILDAIDAALGGKVSSRVVRRGEEEAQVEATFELNPPLGDWLASQNIEPLEGHLLVCSREITLHKEDGSKDTKGNRNNSFRSRSRINGVLANKQQMEAIRQRLVEFTVQGQTMQLGDEAIQREWLDGFGGADAIQQRKAVSVAYEGCLKAEQALEKRRRSESERLQQLDLFQYQMKELMAANLTDDEELLRLEQERQRLSHSVELQKQSYQVYQLLYQNESGGEAVADLLGQSEGILEDMVNYDPQLEMILTMVRDSIAQIQEAGQQINLYGENLETNPQRLEEVEDRMIQLKQICRKYGSLRDAIAHYHHIQVELEGLRGGGQSLEDLTKAYEDCRYQLQSHCTKLTELRHTIAHDLQRRLVEELRPLAMDKVQFQVEISPTEPTAWGADQITFQFSSNPGEPLHPLTEVASGGEMSRFLLALKACFSQVDPVGTLVFDEIDVGVSGRVAQAIGEKLYQLSMGHQVLCITHQPIVAAMADYHFQVTKQVIDQTSGKKAGTMQEPNPDELRTVVKVNRLDEWDRCGELALLASGKTDHEAIAFADSLLDQAANLRKKLINSSKPMVSPSDAELVPENGINPNPKPKNSPSPRKGKV